MFYTFLLTLHNLWRWVVLVMAIVATVGAVAGWLGKREWSERDRKRGSFNAMFMDIQFLLGLLLYIFGEYGIKALSKGMEFIKANQGDYLFFSVEHIFYMLVAVVLAHLGSSLPKRAQESKKKFMRAAIPFVLMLLVLIIGIPWWRPLLRLFGVTLP
jgi:hypothetical protein